MFTSQTNSTSDFTDAIAQAADTVETAMKQSLQDYAANPSAEGGVLVQAQLSQYTQFCQLESFINKEYYGTMKTIIQNIG